MFGGRLLTVLAFPVALGEAFVNVLREHERRFDVSPARQSLGSDVVARYGAASALATRATAGSSRKDRWK